MSAASEEAQSSIDALPFRQGALDAQQIRDECPQFRVLIIGKANAGKTTILRKVCNAKPGAKPIVYDAEGKEVKHTVGRILQSWTKLTKLLVSSNSRGSSCYLSVFTG